MSKNAWSPGRMSRSEKLCGCGLHRSPRDRVDRLDLVRTHLVEPLVRERDDLVLAHARLERLDDVLVDAVDHRGGLGEQHDLVGRLDLPRVEHQLLAVDDRQALPLHLEQERRLDDVDAHRRVRDAGLLEQGLDLARPRRPSARPSGAIAPRMPSMPARSSPGRATGSRAGGAAPRNRSPTASARRRGSAARTGSSCRRGRRRSRSAWCSGCCRSRRAGRRRTRWPPARRVARPSR